MSEKRPGPYNRLKRIAQEYIAKLERPRPKREMYTISDLKPAYDLRGIAERVAAADTLGWDTMLTFKDGILRITYVQRVENPHRPWELT